MPSNESRGAVPGWKKSAGAAPGKQDPRRLWQRESAARGKPGNRRRWLRLAGSLGLVAVIAALVYLIGMILALRPVTFILAGAGYETHLAVPHNAYGWHGLGSVEQSAEQGTQSTSWYSRGKLKLERPLRLTSQNTDELQDRLDSAQGDTVILCLAMHGGADKDHAYLFPEDVRYSGSSGMID